MPTQQCPSCGEQVDDVLADTCPYCGEQIVDESVLGAR
jgi:hypothetical protein